jgi:DNA replication and repair protein RecF
LERGQVAIQRLELEEFRVYRALSLDVPPEGLRIHGRNGSGKTTILEAVELVSTTRPRRGANDGDLINHASGVDLGVQPYARVIADVMRGDAHARVEVFTQRLERRNATKKLLRVAERPRRAGDVVGLVPTVTFTPDDLELILGSPSARRRFLDVFLSQVDRRYLRTLSRYAKILAQRNGLLRSAGESDPALIRDQLSYWDEQLVGLGAYIVAARVRAMSQLSRSAAERFTRLSPDAGELAVRYAATIEQSDTWWQQLAQLEDILDAVQLASVEFERQLRASQAAELARGVTTVGPHRDDLSFELDGRPLTRFGSRGQQRVAVMATKLAEMDLATELIGLRPILLLDDVLSELDPEHREALMAGVSGSPGQLLVTATERGLLDRSELAGLAMIEVAGNGIVNITP